MEQSKTLVLQNAAKRATTQKSEKEEKRVDE